MSEHKYPRTAVYAGTMHYRVRHDGARPEFQKDGGDWAQSQDFFTERHLFTNPNVLETTPSVPFKRLLDWLDDPHRKPPHLAFSAGPEREIADRITTMIEVHCEAVTKRDDLSAELVAKARDALEELKLLEVHCARNGIAVNVAVMGALAAALGAYEKGGAK